MRMREAAPDEMAAVLRARDSVRGEKLSPGGPLAGGDPLMEISGVRGRSRFIIGVDEGDDPVASLRVYDFEGELQGRRVRIAGIGELFTLPEKRGRRFGAALVESVLDRARHERSGLALLLSDIGAGCFMRLGFTLLPGWEASCVTTLPAPWPGEPEWVREAAPPLGVPGLRPGGPGDVETLMRLHAGYESAAPFRIIRERRSWEEILSPADGRRRPGDNDPMAIWILDDAAGPVAYAVLRARSGVMRWLEHGARPGGERRLGDLFWAAIAAARRRSLNRLEGWTLPAGEAGETLYPIARRARRRPLLMARVLDAGITLSGLRAGTDCRFGELDRF